MTLKDIAAASDLQNCYMGFVSWYPIPPTGTPFWRHKSSLLEAFYLTLKFCKTDYTDEWLVLGADLMPLVRSFTKFKEQVPAEHEGSITYLGTLGNIKVYANPTIEDNWWLAGCGFSGARGMVDSGGIEEVNNILNKLTCPASESRQSSC
jgi:hypothetical protein